MRVLNPCVEVGALSFSTASALASVFFGAAFFGVSFFAFLGILCVWVARNYMFSGLIKPGGKTPPRLIIIPPNLKLFLGGLIWIAVENLGDTHIIYHKTALFGSAI